MKQALCLSAKAVLFSSSGSAFPAALRISASGTSDGLAPTANAPVSSASATADRIDKFVVVGLQNIFSAGNLRSQPFQDSPFLAPSQHMIETDETMTSHAFWTIRGIPDLDAGPKKGENDPQ